MSYLLLRSKWVGNVKIMKTIQGFKSPWSPVTRAVASLLLPGGQGKAFPGKALATLLPATLHLCENNSYITTSYHLENWNWCRYSNLNLNTAVTEHYKDLFDMIDFNRYEIHNSECGIIPGTDLIYAQGHEVGYSIDAGKISNAS